MFAPSVSLLSTARYAATRQPQSKQAKQAKQAKQVSKQSRPFSADNRWPRSALLVKGGRRCWRSHSQYNTIQPNRGNTNGSAGHAKRLQFRCFVNRSVVTEGKDICIIAKKYVDLLLYVRIDVHNDVNEEIMNMSMACICTSM